MQTIVAMDGLQLADALRAGIYRLFQKTDHINKINVFPVPDGDTVVLDLNRAVSPPCAFTVHATCPLPPLQNHLPVTIEAGERHDGGRH